MILPITTIGNPVLRRKAEPITADYPELAELIANMYETMYNASGVGLAAPQVGLSIRLFITDGKAMFDESKPDERLLNFKKVFINPEILIEEGDKWGFAEGCLSIPTIREDVKRNGSIKVRYLDEHFQTHEEDYDGLCARIIQHEYDHIEGILFIDKISPLRKQLIRSRLRKIAQGEILPDYPTVPNK